MVYVNGTCIQEARRNKGLSCRELAVLLDTTQKTIRVWEKNPTKISPRNLWRISTILNINPENLIK